MTDKLCPRCFQIKPIEEFYPSKSGRLGRCKLCYRVINRERDARGKAAAEAARELNRLVPPLVYSSGHWKQLAICDQSIVPQLTSVFKQIDEMRIGTI